MDMNWSFSKRIFYIGLASLLLLGLPSTTLATMRSDSLIYNYTPIDSVMKDPVNSENEFLSDQHKDEEYTAYDYRVERFRTGWARIIPSHSKAQLAGNMGLLSFGIGWDYGKNNQWETDVMYGFIPKNSSKKAKITMTVKQNYMPWNLDLNNNFSVEPLACGLYLNTVFGDQFWVSEPERFPKGYYGFSSKIRIHIYLGQRLTYKIDPAHRFFAKSISFFYELSTCDLYFISAVTNKYLRPRDYLSLSFGLKFQWL